MRILPAGERDIRQIQKIARETWPQTYANILSPDQLDYMLGLFYSTESLQDQMRQGHRFFIMGKIGFASCSPGHAKPKVAQLHKLYVLPGYQGTGAGMQLLNTAIHWAIDHNMEAIELNVNRFNKAKQFYEKHGFVVTHEVDVPIGRGYYMNDFVMRRCL